MKLLLLLPLIFAWNFIFWGAVGLIRCVSETVSKYRSWFVPAVGLLTCVYLLTESPVVLAPSVFPSVIAVGLVASLVAVFHVSRAFAKKHGEKTYEKTIARISRPAFLHPPGTVFEAATGLKPDDASCKPRNAEASKLINGWLLKLDPASRDIVVRRLGLYGHEKTTLREAGQESGKSTLQVREVQVDALKKLHNIQLDLEYKKKLFNVVASEYNLTRIEGEVSQKDKKSTLRASGTVETQENTTDHWFYNTKKAQVNQFYPNELIALVAVIIATVCVAPIWQASISGYQLALELHILLIAVALGILTFILFLTASLLSDKTTVRPTVDSTVIHGGYNELFSSSHVAVLIPAYNEGAGVEPTIKSAINLVRRENVFVVNDCSADNTSEIVSKLGVNFLDLTTNVGKANALDKAIRHFDICNKFQFLLILDADTEIDPQYLKFALPKFDNPKVSVVAGHAIPKWDKGKAYSRSSFFVAYRIKLYMMTQAFLRYGQTSMHLNVSFIVPGFSSIYRTTVIPKIDITAPGLVIEDFNMTFELHRKELGKIAYTPNAVAYCHEPHSFKDYTSQIKRWHLGFWQTVKKHGFWSSTFSLALSLFILESVIISLAFVSLPLIGLNAISSYLSTGSFLPVGQTFNFQVFFVGVLVVFWLDMASTAIIALITKKPALMWHGVFFFLLRWIDAFYFIITIPMAFIVKSNGRWTSPSRLPSQT